jgi:hypothetical protein
MAVPNTAIDRKGFLIFARFWFFVPVFISIDQNQERVWKKVTFLFGLQ